MLLLLLSSGMEFFERIDAGATETCPGLSSRIATIPIDDIANSQ
jgi:hypothetical protein